MAIGEHARGTPAGHSAKLALVREFRFSHLIDAALGHES